MPLTHIVIISLLIVSAVLGYALAKKSFPLRFRPIDWVKAKMLLTLDRLIISIAAGMKKLHLRINPPKVDGDNLTATENADKIEAYAPEIENGLIDPNVANMAITGTYGAGKSSIIKTFFKANPEYRTINVSLAAFNEGSVTKKELQSIEYNILAQIFYHVKGGTIPYSRFKRIQHVPQWLMIVAALVIFIYGLSVYGLISTKPEQIAAGQLGKWIVEHSTAIKYGCGSFFVVFTVAILYAALRIYHLSKLKVKVQNTELEISPENSASALDKHLDEIVYFFSVTPFNVVILEDLDRFESTDIFVKLREISVLVNNSRQVGRKVTFIYALRDDIFKDESRTKFFDKIIPIVPVINVGNASSHLLNRINGTANPPICTPAFVKDISLYVYDMRLLRNIVSEFNIYRKLINDFDTNSDRLLAMIVYKNKFPTDFSELQFDKGKIFELFAKRDEYIQQITQTIQQQRSELQARITYLNQNHLNSIKELRLVYLATIAEYLFEQDNNSNPRFGVNSLLTIGELTRDENFEGFRTAQTIVYGYHSHSSNTRRFDFSRIEERVGAPMKYQERLAKMAETVALQTGDANTQLADLDHQLAICRNFTMVDILAHPAVKGTATPISDEKLLFYLVSNGYINEEYQYYLSYFEEGDITRDDLAFIWSVKNRKALSYNYSLTKLPGIIDRLTEREFNQEEIRNNDLFAYMVANFDIEDARIKNVFKHVYVKGELELEFIEQFVQSGIQVPEFIRALCRHCPGIHTATVLGGYKTEGFKHEMQQHFIRYADIEDYLKFNENGIISKLQARKTWLLRPGAHNFDRLKVFRLIDLLKIRFDLQEIYIPTETTVIDSVLMHGRYALKPVMINNVLLWSGATDLDEVNRGQLTHILAGKNIILREKIEANLPAYITEVFLPIQQHDKESPQTILHLLGHEKLDDQIKSRIISTVPFVLDNIAAIVSPTIRIQLLSHRRVKATWENIKTFYLQPDETGMINGADGLLLGFIDDDANMDSLYEQSGTIATFDQADKDMLVNFLTYGALSDRNFAKLATITPRRIEAFSFENLSKTHSGLIIAQKKAAVNIGNLTSLIDKYPELAVEWIMVDKDEFKASLPYIEMREDKIAALFLTAPDNVEVKDFLWERISDWAVLTMMTFNVDAPPARVQRITEPPKNLTLAVILANKAISHDNKLSLLLKAHQTLEEAELEKSIQSLGAPLDAIVNRDEKDCKVLISDQATQLLTTLRESGRIVRNFTENRKYIHVTRTWDPE